MELGQLNFDIQVLPERRVSLALRHHLHEILTLDFGLVFGHAQHTDPNGLGKRALAHGYGRCCNIHNVTSSPFCIGCSVTNDKFPKESNDLQG